MPRIAMLALLLLPGCDVCQADTGGCDGTEMLLIAPCALGSDAERFDDLLAGHPTAGTEVTVWGPLVREAGSCTQLGCALPNTCCNSCGAGMGLSDAGDYTYFEAADLQLLGTVDGVDLACGGDESVQCCPIPTDTHDVAVTGTLMEFGTSLDGQLWSLQVSDMCIRG